MWQVQEGAFGDGDTRGGQRRHLAPQDTPVDLRHPGGGRAARRAALRAMVNGKLDEQVGNAVAACNEYRVNMTGEVFGICVCGRPKANHNDAALRPKGTGRG